MCLQHALDMDPTDRGAQGKLALVNGYLDLLQANAGQREQRPALLRPRRRSFRKPFLSFRVARIRIWAWRESTFIRSKNIGKAMAELHEAERLGFEPGPREMEEEADGYRFRADIGIGRRTRSFAGQSRAAEATLSSAGAARFRSGTPAVRAHSGFLERECGACAQVDDDDRTRQELDEILKKPVKLSKRQRRTTARRYSRWQ